MHIVRSILMIIISFTLFVLACNESTDEGPSANTRGDDVPPGNKSFGIEKVDWCITSQINPFRAGYTFTVHCQGKRPDSGEINSIRFYLNGSDLFWEYPLEAFIFDRESHTISNKTGFANPKNRHILPLGDITARILLKNGEAVESTFTAHEPGGPSQEEYNVAYSEAFSGRKARTYTPMLKCAQVLKNKALLLREVEHFTAYFRIDDPRAFNAKLQLFNGNEYIGESDFLIDFDTREASTALNGGDDLFNIPNDDDTNVIFLSNSEIHYIGQHGIKDVTHFAVCLSDRVEDAYKPGHFGYRYLSISQITPFN